MNYHRLEAAIMEDEGFRSKPYLDTEGVPTIGYGCTNILGQPVTMDTPRITPANARVLLRAAIFEALIDAETLFPRLAEMPWVRQEVIVNMAYNLGRYRLSRFTKLRRAAEALDYTEMARQMEDSRWYNQVGLRAVRLVRQMETGTP